MTFLLLWEENTVSSGQFHLCFFMKILIHILIWTLFFGVSFSSYAGEITIKQKVTSSTMKKILKLDASIREGEKTRTGSTLARNALLTIIEREWQAKQFFWWLFPTVDKTLSYPLTLQKYKLSCEIAALKIVLNALGKNVSEEDVMSTIPQFKDEYNPVTKIWWDPEIEFVGYYTGSQRKMTGYGVYEQPLAMSINGQYHTEPWNKDTRPKGMTHKEHLQRLLSSLDHGWHVILWWDWCTDPRYEDALISWDKSLLTKIFPLPWKNICERFGESRKLTWKTPDGEEKIWLSWEHAFVLLGYVWKIENPKYIIVWDTDTGRHTYPIHEWMRKWEMMDFRSLLIRDFE